MSWRATFALLLFLVAAYTSVSVFVDSWEGRQCWLDGGNYARLPFATAFRGALDALSTTARSSTFKAAFEILSLTSFIWPLAAILISRNKIIPFSGLVLVLIPFFLLMHDRIYFGFNTFCDGNGMAAVGFAGMQLFIVLPIGLIIFCAALRADD